MHLRNRSCVHMHIHTPITFAPQLGIVPADFATSYCQTAAGLPADIIHAILTHEVNLTLAALAESCHA